MKATNTSEFPSGNAQQCTEELHTTYSDGKTCENRDRCHGASLERNLESAMYSSGTGQLCVRFLSSVISVGGCFLADRMLGRWQPFLVSTLSLSLSLPKQQSLSSVVATLCVQRQVR